MLRRLLKYDRVEMNGLVFGISFSVIAVWTIASFFFAFAQDEGTLGNGAFDNFMANSFLVWRFPAHNLLFLIQDFLPFLGILFFPLLLINVLFYSALIERLTTFIFRGRSED